jgi:two-component system, OmpR family, phosphate regulon response regulator PhoB
MKITLIDDEPDICTYLCAALEDNGHDVITVDENDSVIQVIQKNQPDLIILDIMMPKRSGISIYRELRSTEMFRKIPILLMSGMSSEKSFLPNGFRRLVNDDKIPLPEGFIEKPIRLPELINLVHKLKR